MTDPRLLSDDEVYIVLNALDFYEEWVAEVAEEPDEFGSQEHYRKELASLRSMKNRLLKLIERCACGARHANEHAQVCPNREVAS